MDPATLLLILRGIQAGIAAAPQVIEVAQKAKEFISSLFSANAISAEQQRVINDHIEVYAAHVRAGTVPPEFTVEADPV